MKATCSRLATTPRRCLVLGSQAVPFTVHESSTWPGAVTATLTLDLFSGSALRREDFNDQNLGCQIRSWTRFLHTGEAFGWGGQLIAGLASLGEFIPVYSDFALSWRRCFGRRSKPAPTASAGA